MTELKNLWGFVARMQYSILSKRIPESVPAWRGSGGSVCRYTGRAMSLEVKALDFDHRNKLVFQNINGCM